MELRAYYSVGEDLSSRGSARAALINPSAVTDAPSSDPSPTSSPIAWVNELATGRRRPTATLRFDQTEGSSWPDLVGTTLASVRLVSERVLSAFAASGVTGWEGIPVDVHRADGHAVRGYHLFVVKGRSGPIDNARSVQVDRIRLVKGSQRSSKVWRGLFFDESTWDGSDVFAPGRSAFCFVTQKVKDTLERENATNFSIRALVDIERVSLV
jgi:hypothetical protein